VLSDNFTAALIGSIRVVVVPPDIVGAERAVIVGIGLSIGNSVELLKDSQPLPALLWMDASQRFFGGLRGFRIGIQSSAIRQSRDEAG